MRNFRQLSSILLTVGMTMVSLPALSVENLVESGIVGRSNHTKQKHKSTLDRILDIFRRKLKDGGSRRDSFCPIWPSNGDPDLLEIWHERPLFIWQGTVREIEVRLPATESAIWRYEVVEDEQQVFYEGPELQPGEEYDYWVRYEVTEEGETTTDEKTIPFIIKEERETIAKELMRLEGASEEEKALARAEYFAEQGLWSDFMWEVFGVANPSVEWQKALEEIRKESCSLD
ncbi:MAG: hypothetical protein F6K14_28940 [Symploca sp. SIO2C1]|nr:hypothetical protein [Symploca sp. SIO2C1]